MTVLPAQIPIVPVIYGDDRPGPINVMKFFGEGWVPKDVLRRRRYSLETMRRVGSPVLIKHMWNDQDRKTGVAQRSPSMSRAYNQPRHDDPLSHGVGFVSTELAPDEWYDNSTGAIVVADASPGPNYTQAPLYRGFGPGYLTYIIEPDASEDMFRLNEAGALIEVQNATAQAPWFPQINDNDLIINVILDNQFRIIDTEERYQAKQTNPVSMRGRQRRGQREYGELGGNKFLINQQFQMTLVPQTDALYNVEIDR